ncbi:MAG: hypothetical protein EHM35_19055 [Planctomycetaceae bacterium]|nr:MAG: hypothetical protein EHM35_19055 [Planctomycetaceae bacterium]
MLLCIPIIQIEDTETMILCTCGEKLTAPRPYQALNRLMLHLRTCRLLQAYPDLTRIYRSVEPWTANTNADTRPAAQTNDSPDTTSISLPSTAL